MVPVTPEPAARNWQLIEALRVFTDEWFGPHFAGEHPHFSEFLAERLASRVVWRDNLAPDVLLAVSALKHGAVWRGFDGPDGVTKDEALEHAAVLAEFVARLVGE